MKERNTIHAFLLHYGISTVLLCMLVAIVVMLNTVDINQRVTADVLKGKGGYKAYMVKNTYLSLDKGDSLTIDAMEGEKLTFTIQSVMEEPDYYVVCMTPEVRPVVERAFRGNSKLSGYVYTHKVKLWHLVFSKISLNKNTLW